MATTGIIISLVLLMWLAYRGINVLLLAPLMALLALLFTGDMALLLPTYTQVFMKAMGGYLIQFFPLFLLGALFGKLMEDSGSAHAVALGITRWLGSERAILTVVMVCALLTYGGVSLFVVAFAVFPIGSALFARAGIPRQLLPAAIALGAFTFTMTALPGTPSIQNAIPSPYFGTDAFAAPGLGVLAALIMLVLGMWWLNRQARRMQSDVHGDDSAPGDSVAAMPVNAQVQGNANAGAANLPSFMLALAPMALVITINFLMAKWVLPASDLGMLARPEYGGLGNPRSVIGLWSIILGLLAANAFLLVAHWRRWADAVKSVNDGAYGAMLPILNTASEVGYGSVIASLAGFVLIRDALLGIAPGNPLISEAIAVNVLSGITGSASGGLSIALQTLGQHYLELARTAGISPELLHRVAVMSSGGFDTLPHNGAVVSLLAICKLTHRDAYRHIAMNTLVFPLVALVAVIALGSAFGSF